MTRDTRVHSDYDPGLEVEELRKIGWVLAIVAGIAWCWLLIDVAEDGIGPVLAVFLQAVGTLAAIGSGTSAVLCGVKAAEHRVRFVMTRERP